MEYCGPAPYKKKYKEKFDWSLLCVILFCMVFGVFISLLLGVTQIHSNHQVGCTHNYCFEYRK